MASKKITYPPPPNITLTRPLIAVDWGTTSLRAALILNAKVQEERSSDQGIMSVAPGDFPNVLSQICSQWLDFEDVLILIGGMAGSAQGWQLAPYCPCPVSVHYLANHLHWINPHKIGIVPELSIEHEHAPDVIRGEEVQVLGALSMLGKNSARLVLPGTHSKWVEVREGVFEDFSTYITGEFFSILKDHSILSKTLSTSSPLEFNAEAFDKGLDLRLKSKPDRKNTKLEGTGNNQARTANTMRKPNLLHDIFGIRTLALFDRHNPEYLVDVLSGLVIGYELQTQSFRKNEEIIVVGTSALQTYYSHALERLGACPITLGSEATWRGFQVIAQTIDHGIA
jgi:2-dehydro-3-deoxygalactonokinase